MLHSIKSTVREKVVKKVKSGALGILPQYVSFMIDIDNFSKWTFSRRQRHHPDADDVADDRRRPHRGPVQRDLGSAGRGQAEEGHRRAQVPQGDQQPTQ